MPKFLRPLDLDDDDDPRSRKRRRSNIAADGETVRVPMMFADENRNAAVRILRDANRRSFDHYSNRFAHHRPGFWTGFADGDDDLRALNDAAETARQDLL